MSTGSQSPGGSRPGGALKSDPIYRLSIASGGAARSELFDLPYYAEIIVYMDRLPRSPNSYDHRQGLRRILFFAGKLWVPSRNARLSRTEHSIFNAYTKRNSKSASKAHTIRCPGYLQLQGKRLKRSCSIKAVLCQREGSARYLDWQDVVEGHLASGQVSTASQQEDGAAAGTQRRATKEAERPTSNHQFRFLV